MICSSSSRESGSRSCRACWVQRRRRRAVKGREKILVVDDDPNLRKTLADILRVKGYDTTVAGTGADATAAAEQEKFSLALIDLMLPDIPGLEVMERIKAVSPLTEAI